MEVIFKEPITLPLDMDQMEMAMEDRSSLESVEAPLIRPTIMGWIDYKNTGEHNKGEALINFVSNLNFSFRIVIDYSIPYDERAGLMMDFMDVRAISDIPTLRQTLEVMLIEYKREKAGNPVPKDERLDKNLWLNYEERKKFRTEQSAFIADYVKFLDNVIIMMPYHSKGYAAGLGKDEIKNGNVIVNEGKNVIGLNIGTLLSSQGFLEEYFSYPRESKPEIYEHYMFDPVFRGDSMMSILFKGNSLMMKFMMEMFDERVPVEQVAEDLKKMSEDFRKAQSGFDSKAD